MPTHHLLPQKPGRPTPGSHSTLRPHIASTEGEGILTFFPSTTAFALALGADSPCADERCAGNLGLSASGLFTRFNATHVSIRTSHTSRAPRRYSFTGLGNALLPRAPDSNSLPSPTQSVRDGFDLGRFRLTSLAREVSLVQAHHITRRLNQAHTRSFGYRLSPVTSSAQDDSISELLRFL